MVYEVLYYDGWGEWPAYYLIGEAEGESPEEALESNLQRLTTEVRERFSLSPDDSRDEQIQEAIYVLRNNSLVSIQEPKVSS